RTALIDQQTARANYGVGAGITWDSDGAEEYRECLDKASVLTRTTEDFALIETLLWTPGKGYFILSEHLERLQSSAEYFDFRFDREATESYLNALALSFPAAPQRVRLLL
ncbi:MAG: aminodeoxychorismate synthase, component I, partial [Gammaproteobacteria bacterium]|nr:aminodeoxychorismate synthase, component I [Gammaproteobacteria bacterium]